MFINETRGNNKVHCSTIYTEITGDGDTHCKSSPTDLRHYDQDNTPLALTHTSPVPRQSPTSLAQPPVTYTLVKYTPVTCTPVTDITRHSPMPLLSHPLAPAQPHTLPTLSPLLLTQPPVIAQPPMAQKQLTNTRCTGAYITVNYNQHIFPRCQHSHCRRHTLIPPSATQPQAQPPVTSTTYAANTCISRNARCIAASLSTPISPDIAPLMRYLPIM
jgi:hypothetical protein